jgi:hypothetical protein
VPVLPQARPDPRIGGLAQRYITCCLVPGPKSRKWSVSQAWIGVIRPSELVYQWSNPGLKPLIYLVFNLNPEDQNAVLVLRDTSHTR